MMNTKNILITGGPVHAHLDAVKILTNRFRGGLMCQLAEDLLRFDANIIYLCAPKVGAELPAENERIKVVTHNGFNDYRAKVAELAPSMDAVILGAAVANLIPVHPYEGKFPSHKYKPGDIIPIDFTIAPRVIDEVKVIAPKTHLFGYKLLDGVSFEELIGAAYGIVLEAKAMAVFANDAQNLQQKFAVTKERGVHPLTQQELAPWIWQMINDEYYKTVLSATMVDGHQITRDALESAYIKTRSLIAKFEDTFTTVENGLIFGTVAVRCGAGFMTTGRGKRELESTTIARVRHEDLCVFVYGNTKASLNAPLLAKMFENPAVDHIVHFHQQMSGLPTYSYAPPGTVRDSNRPNHTSFNILGHGCMLLFNQEGRRL